MRILFMGTGEFAVPSLRAVAEMPGHELVAVVTQPDRPRGRALQPAAPPVKVAAVELGLPVWQPQRIADADAVAQVRAARPDLIIVVAYGQLLPPSVLEIPPLGCINVHASLLPRWRGAAPVQHAILAGDTETGVTTMFVNERLDAGDIILQRREPIRPDDTGATLERRLAMAGAALLVETVELVAKGCAPRTPQDESRVTLARKLTKEDGRVDWSKPAELLERQVRAFDPWPGTFTHWGTLILKIWRAAVVPHVQGIPGTVLAGGVVVTGCGGLRLLEIQPAGGVRMPFEAFACGHRDIVGSRLG